MSNALYLMSLIVKLNKLKQFKNVITEVPRLLESKKNFVQVYKIRIVHSFSLSSLPIFRDHEYSPPDLRHDTFALRKKGLQTFVDSPDHSD